MAKHILKLYPVANGDTTFFKLSDLTTILVDCKIRGGDEDSNGNKIFDVKGDLLNEVQKRNLNPFLDLFVLTHPDEDHCLGFNNNFYTGDPASYASENRENNEIIVNELWATSMLFNGASNEDAKTLKKEAERRRKLWENDDPNKNKDGNRIRMIGYDGDNRFEKVPNSIPGDTLTLRDINGNLTGNFEFFLHGPFKKSLIESNAEKDKNTASIILQARFKDKASDDWTCYFLTGGDADHYRWKEVLEKSKNHDNEEKLLWDIFQTPHHCSWTYFNDVPYDNEGNNEPKESSHQILDYGRVGSYIIASSKKITNNQDNPPHYAAKKEYLKKVKSENFLNTNVNGDEKKPTPIIFEISTDGIKQVNSVKSEKDKLAAASLIASRSAMSGNWGNK